tara:strand:+ start:16 stop:1953 length:1938 start_codon:yes stop_codon:yes gene_type:complete
LILRLYLICLISFSIFPGISSNTYGQLGYLNTPSAFTLEESSILFDYSRSEPDRKINLTLSPLNRLDATIFYVDISNKPYPGFPNQSYKDKGFNIKYKLIDSSNFAMSIGLNDFAGTSIYGSEYLVFSHLIGELDYSVGIGWGFYSNGINVNNPFSRLNDRFKIRNKNSDPGGTLNTGTFFSGDSSLFGALSYKLTNDIRVIAELDPSVESEIVGYKFQRKKINIGFEYSQDDYSFKISSFHNKNINAQLTLKRNFLDYNSRPKYVFKKNIENYKNLQEILERNKIGLVSVFENKETLYLEVKQNFYQNQYQANERVKKLAKSFMQKNKELIISQNVFDMEVLRTYYDGSLSNVRNEEYTDKTLDNLKYRVIEKFPIINNRIYPSLKSYLAAREGFLFTGLLIENDLEINFKENLIFLSNFKYSIVDNFNELVIPPDTTFPNQVRSDNKDYLRNFNQRVVLGRFELNYLKSLDRRHFFLISAGIFEDMFGGLGAEYLFFPEGSLFSLGAEFLKIKKRDYDMRFSFKDYENTLLRTNISIYEPKTDIKFKLSFGEYLAGDQGYTFEAGRVFENGVKMSAFFTRTNISKLEFGEGSFDKGIRFTIPFSIFRNNNLTRYEWRPLTKDPGAMLIKGIRLEDYIEKYRVY